MATIFFVTNRAVEGDGDTADAYGTAPMAAGAEQHFGRAEIDIIFHPATAGELITGTAAMPPVLYDVRTGSFPREDWDTLRGFNGTLLVMLTGFGEGMTVTLQDAAFLQSWYGTPRKPLQVILFSWPSLSGLQLVRDVLASGPHDGRLQQDYFSSQVNAGASGDAIASFFEVLSAELGAAIAGGKRVILAQSMGNTALSSGLQSWLRAARRPLFNQAILCAPDVPERAFSDPAQLQPLNQLARDTLVLRNSKDRVLALSGGLAGNGPRLGANPGQALPGWVRSFDVSSVKDFDAAGLLDSHCYYQLSKTVRARIQSFL